eukprot:9417746-Pyramimonas_sp.AAC.1
MKPSAGLPMGPRTVRRVRPNGAAPPCGTCHLGLRLISIWGHEPCEGASKWCGAAMLTLLLEPLVELTVGLRTV